MLPGMRITVIITTYETPGFLERVLLGYAAQTRPAEEIVIADDGSGPGTARLVARMRTQYGLPLVHVWHEDRGFRKSLILNRAILRATSDYLLFTDGDCIPRRDMVAAHARLARPGRFVAGGYLKLPAPVSDRIGADEIASGRFAELDWLRTHGWRPGRRALRLTTSSTLGALFDAITPTRAEFQGNNASTWRSALQAVNGFESHMGYGGLDKALGRRLRNAGVRGIQARHRAVCLHLYHDRPYRDPHVVRANRAAIRRITRSGETRARVGLVELEQAAS
jgi:glycosyltransferase involved in cell wall biosynthesis